MIKINLDMQDEAYDNAMYILHYLPKNNVTKLQVEAFKHIYSSSSNEQ